MEDLKAAGLNPNLAAGSAASSGAVVGRNSTAGLGAISGNSIGSALDAMTAVQQLRNIKEQNKILKNQAWQTQDNTLAVTLNNLYSNAEIAYMLGMNPKIKVDKDGAPTL